ncbi:hypothetical protein niasHS_013291 [Heterodera schachtii]|uniref:Uncharacterized protein n=1 Tax=Heterodera schachtii TaxID=97005 RepID=A0ABD2IAT2_HETSC
MEDTAEDFHHGLVVRATGESLLIWSPEHDLVKASGPELNSQWTVGTWVQYRAIADGPTQNRLCEVAKPTFMVYEISRVRINGSLPEVDVHHENGNVHIELSIFITGPIRHLDEKCVLANDYLLGPVLCESNAELIQKIENVDYAQVELKVTFSEDFPELARFVALAFRDESNEQWIKLKILEKKRENNSSGQKANGTPEIARQIDEDENDSTKKAFGTMAKPKQSEEIEHRISRGVLTKPKQTDSSDNEEDGAEENCLPSTSIRKPNQQSNALRDSTSSLFSLHGADPCEEKDEFANWKSEFGDHDSESEQLENASEPSHFEKEEKIIAELSHYQKEHFEGLQRRKRSFGLIVEKMFDYAIVYSKKFGLAILPSSRFPSLQQFDSFCVVGQWLLSVIVEVSNSQGLTFSHMCLPPFERTDQKNVQTLVNSEGKVEILLNCDFSISNLKSLGLDQYVLSTELGDVLVNEAFIRQNGIFENVSNVWVRYIGGKYFFWEIDAEAKLVTDSDDEIVFIHSDDEATCSNITKQLETVKFICEDSEDMTSAITTELASIFTANAASNESRPKVIEQRILDVSDGCEKENEQQHNYEAHNAMIGGIDGEENGTKNEAGVSSTVPSSQNAVEQQAEPPLAQEDFSSIYNYAIKTFWPRLCKDKRDGRQNDLDEGNQPNYNNNELELD